MGKPKGYFMLVLHHHLPFVKHPEYEFFLEEHWLFEAIVETYIPLLMMLRRLEQKGVEFRITVSLTPPLCEMLVDSFLMDKFRKYLDRTIALTEKEMERTKRDATLNVLARFYNERLLKIREFFEDWLKGNVLEGYKYFQSQGKMEIITCAATHGVLPLLQPMEKAVECQIKVAVKNYRKHFGTNPFGIWLPECAYYPEVEGILKKYGIRYFFLDTHGVACGRPSPRYGVYSPVETPCGLLALGRDPESTKQVWSSKEGYPGDPWYRDFYRDIWV